MARTRSTGSVIKHTFLLAALVLAASTLTGCNTARGFGQDVQNLGTAISHSAG